MRHLKMFEQYHQCIGLQITVRPILTQHWSVVVVHMYLLTRLSSEFTDKVVQQFLLTLPLLIKLGPFEKNFSCTPWSFAALHHFSRIGLCAKFQVFMQSRSMIQINIKHCLQSLPLS